MSKKTAASPKPLRHLLSIADLTREDVEKLFALTRELKDELKAAHAKRVLPKPRLQGAVLAMIFQKPSLRTRCTFEAGMYQLGGHAMYLAPSDIGLGRRESVKDVAQSLGRWAQIIMARVFMQTTIHELADHAGIPVINGLSELEHPCQVLGDFFSMLEHHGSLKDFRLTWVGDGFNVCNSLMLLSAIMDVHLTMSTPKGYDPPDSIWKLAHKLNPRADEFLKIERDPARAVANADAVYTDIWASMGLETEAEQRKKDFAPYQVNAALMEKAPKHAVVMHDLPAHRGEEITDEVMDSPRAAIICDQAENRLHVQKAIMCTLAGE